MNGFCRCDLPGQQRWTEREARFR